MVFGFGGNGTCRLGDVKWFLLCGGLRNNLGGKARSGYLFSKGNNNEKRFRSNDCGYHEGRQTHIFFASGGSFVHGGFLAL
jgi:hypothetical protein